MLISLVPLVAGTIWTVGIMGAAGMDFNLANSIFMPLVVGAGVEYGVIIIHRWREGRVGYGRPPFQHGQRGHPCGPDHHYWLWHVDDIEPQGDFQPGFCGGAGSICVLLAALFILPAILSFMKDPAPVVEKEAANVQL